MVELRLTRKEAIELLQMFDKVEALRLEIQKLEKENPKRK
jgi:hypothetical protein